MRQLVILHTIHCSWKAAFFAVRLSLPRRESNSTQTVNILRSWRHWQPYSSRDYSNLRFSFIKGTLADTAGTVLMHQARHSQQCSPLLQAHVLHQVVNRGLSTQPRDYVPKTAPTRPAQEVATSCSALGLAHPVVQLEGFLLLANNRNHCYANSSLQCLYWLLPSIRDSLMQEAQRVSQLVRITSEHTSLVHGIMPQALLAQEQGRSGKGRKGSEGRRHVHLISEEDRGQDVMSGFRENATMVIAVDARHAMRQGVTFYRSKNGVVLTSDRIPSASILHYESLGDNQKYDRRGNPM